MNSYVIKKLLELNEKIEQMTPEEAKKLFDDHYISPTEMGFMRSFNKKEEEPHVASPEFLRKT